MTEISGLKSRVKGMIAKEQQTHFFIHQELEKFSLYLLDRLFQNYIKTHYSNKYLPVLRVVQFSLDGVLALAKKANEDLNQNSTDDVNADCRKKEFIKLIWDEAKSKTMELKIEELYKFIPTLKKGNLREIVNHLGIVQDIIE